MPTWEETVERYRLSKADQKIVADLLGHKGSNRSTSHAVKSLAVSSRSAKNGTSKASGVARKTKSRAQGRLSV
jgi:hypothetical protein